MRLETVYLDYNAGAPPRPCVLNRLRTWPAEAANPSSLHGPGRTARGMIETARADVAALVGADPAQVVFNSGATEGNNTVLASFTGRRILVSAIEHPSVLEAAPDAERIPVTPEGVIDLEALEPLIKTGSPPALLCVMLVNNETGVIQPVDDVIRLARRCNAAVLIDAAQAAGRIPLDMRVIGADFMTFSAHKIGGLPGVGALVLGNCIPPPVLLRGGGQEHRARAGTENVPGIVAFGLAARDAKSGLATYADLATLRNTLESHVESRAPETVFFGRSSPRVPNTSLFAVPGLPSQTALIHMDLAGISISSGSACSSGVVRPSAVLRAMSVPETFAPCALRVSLGWGTTGGDVDRFIAAFDTMIDRMKARRAQAV